MCPGIHLMYAEVSIMCLEFVLMYVEVKVMFAKVHVMCLEVLLMYVEVL